MAPSLFLRSPRLVPPGVSLFPALWSDHPTIGVERLYPYSSSCIIYDVRASLSFELETRHLNVQKGRCEGVTLQWHFSESMVSLASIGS